MNVGMSFRIGQIIEHRRFGYRGVIYRRDQSFDLTDEWYEEMAQSRPPKDKPWYGVLVDDSVSTTYVAERNLRLSDNNSQVEHPLIAFYFEEFDGEEYKQRAMN